MGADPMSPSELTQRLIALVQTERAGRERAEHRFKGLLAIVMTTALCSWGASMFRSVAASHDDADGRRPQKDERPTPAVPMMLTCHDG